MLPNPRRAAVPLGSPTLGEAKGALMPDDSNMAPRPRQARRSRSRRQGVLNTLIEDASGVIQTVANEVTPGVVGALDINGVVERVDIQRIVNRVDVEEVVGRVDLNRVLEQIDLDVVLARADINSLLAGLDFNALLENVDLDTVLDNININALLAHIDINALVETLDMDAIVAQLDINAIVARVDIEALVQRTEIGSIIATATSGVTGKALDVARSEGVGLDFRVQDWTNRLLRRRESVPPDGPALLVREKEPV